jgi:cytoskeletal protein CcmA (bactofilin family)
METPKPARTAHEMLLIGKSIAIKGEVSCDEDLYIDGQVEGAIDPKGNRLTIGPNGRGEVEGNIQANERVELKRSAVVVGDIVTQRISIDEGACIKGSVDLRKELAKKELAA